MDVVVTPSVLRFEVASTLEQMMALEPLAKAHLAETRYGDEPFTGVGFKQAAQKACLQPKQMGVLIAYVREKPVGVIYCTLNPFLVLEQVLLCNVQWFYIDAEIRKSLLGGKVANGLFNGARSWAKTRNARELTISNTADPNSHKLHRFLKRRGAQTIGGCYAVTL